MRFRRSTLTRRALLRAAGSAAALPVGGAAPAPLPAPGTFFPFGTHIYREPSLPLEQLRADLPLLKSLGFNMVKVQESWANDETRDGAIDLSRVAGVIAAAREHGLWVYLGLTMEVAPAWLWTRFPDAQLVYEDGRPHNDQLQYVIPADGKPGPCWHHAGVRAAAIRFLEAVGRELGRFDNILAWNVWQEIGFWPMRPGHSGFCYCPRSLGQFRAWLRSRYTGLDALNATWRSAYSSFDDIVPPRAATDVPPNIDFRFFMEDVYIPQVLRWKADALHRSDPGRRSVFAHADAATIGSGQHAAQSGALDFFGGSCYPAWTPLESWDAGRRGPGRAIDRIEGLNAEIWNPILLRFDYLRSATRDGNLWAAELQGGPIVRGIQRRRVPSAADVRRWGLGLLAAGARGLSFWNHRAEIFWREQFGFGLLELEGDAITERAAEAGRLARALHRWPALFAQGTVPPAEVAILVNEGQYQLLHNTFAEPGSSRPDEHLEHTIRGIHRALWDHGIPVDFIDRSQLAARLSRYRVLIAPFPLTLAPSLVEALRAFVHSGGTLVAEACPGRLTEYGFAVPGGLSPELRILFGIGHKEVQIIREPEDGAIWTGTEAAFGDSRPYHPFQGAGHFAGFTVSPAFLAQSLSLTTAEPVLTAAGEVWGSVNRAGAGHAYLIGTLLGHTVLSYRDPANGRFLERLLARHQVHPDTMGSLKRRRRVHGNQEAWFLFNTSGTVVRQTVPVDGFTRVADLLGEPLPRTGNTVTVAVEPVGIRCLLLER